MLLMNQMKIGKRLKIMKKRDKNIEYRIQIDFSIYAPSVDDKMVMMNMIDELNVNHKVGQITIKLSDDNKWSE